MVNDGIFHGFNGLMDLNPIGAVHEDMFQPCPLNKKVGIIEINFQL